MVSSSARNLAVFTFDSSNGALAFQSIGATYSDGTNGGPATATFNADGGKLAVSTWGVPHFAAPDADLSLQRPGRLYLYGFSNGSLSQTGMYEEQGVSGNIGLSWSPNDQYVYMTNFNLHSSVEDNSVTVHDGTTAAKGQNFPTSDRNDEACWTWVSLDRQRLFTASFTSNAVSTFDIGGDGKLSVSLNPNSVVRRGVPMPDTQGDVPDAGRVPLRGGSISESHGEQLQDRRRRRAVGAGRIALCRTFLCGQDEGGAGIHRADGLREVS